LTVSNLGSVAVGSYTIIVTGTSATLTKTLDLTLNVFNGSLTPSVLTTPANEATNVSITPTLTWNANANALNYLVEIATDNAFVNIVESASVQVPNYSPSSLTGGVQYYWRVTASNTCITANASSIFNFTTDNIVCESFTATDTPISIATNGVNYTSTINIPDDFPITDVNVKINITHQWIRDITASITSPNGTTVELTSVNGNNGAGSYTNTVFDQEATNPITGAVSPFTGSFLPEGDLSEIYGEMSGGNWILTVFDNFPEDTGTLSEFTLELCLQEPLSIDENAISQFSIFPNPNNGEFTIKLNSNSGDDIKVNVYDIRGRVIFNNVYSNTPDFTQTINLNNVQSGMYLVNVNDGRGQVTKKIIVE